MCGFDLRDTVPATYPHILAFPLQLSLMTDPEFPFPAIGLVHIANRIVQHRPIRRSERLDIEVRATPVKDHPRGKQFSLISEARVGDELVWEEISTNLKRGARGAGSDGTVRRPITNCPGPKTSRQPRCGLWAAIWGAATAPCRVT